MNCHLLLVSRSHKLLDTAGRADALSPTRAGQVVKHTYCWPLLVVCGRSVRESERARLVVGYLVLLRMENTMSKSPA
jgi:hypothetical protein